MLKRKLRSKLGFTLIELVVVIAIIGAVGVVWLGAAVSQNNSRIEEQDKTDIKMVDAAVQQYKASNSGLPVLATKISSPVSDNITLFTQKMLAKGFTATQLDTRYKIVNLQLLKAKKYLAGTRTETFVYDVVNDSVYGAEELAENGPELTLNLNLTSKVLKTSTLKTHASDTSDNLAYIDNNKVYLVKTSGDLVPVDLTSKLPAYTTAISVSFSDSMLVVQLKMPDASLKFVNIDLSSL